MELIVSHPNGASVVRDYLANEGAAPKYYRRHFSDAGAFEAKAVEVDGRFDRSARERAAECIIVPEGGDAERLQRFVDEGGYMVTTGQQPALYGGPLYNLHKAMTAICLAEALEARLGKPVLPVFWVASDDHDWAEANHTHLIGVDNELHEFEVRAPKAEVSPPMHRIRLDKEADAMMESFLEALPSTEFSPEYVALLREGFGTGSSLPDGFHLLLQAMLGRFGLYFTDAAHPAVKQHSADLLLGELDRSVELEDVLRTTAKELEGAGYSTQVPIMDGGVNLFLEGPAGRERLYREGEGFRLRTSGTVLSSAEVHAARSTDPASLSPNVLFRPVVESSLFPTLAYVGGPGEMAYFAQLGAYFEAHDMEMPVVFPRWGATPIEGKIRKVLNKFDVEVESLNRPFHEISSEIAREEVPSEVRGALGKLRSAIGGGVGELQKATKSLDPTLKGPVQHLRSQAFSALDDVEKKIMQAVKRESEITLSQLEKAQLHLFPLGKPAERVQNPLYFLFRYGGAVLDDMYEKFTVSLD
jgi:bacillithiol synthase